MSICLCNLSADTLLELASQKKLDMEPATPDPLLFTADPIKAQETLGALADELPKPIELMVGSAQKRRRAMGIASHVWKGSIPKGGVFAIGEGVYVTSPEFTLLQQASQLHQASLCQMLGRYLGTWTPKKDSPTGQGKRAPLTTLESLDEFLKGIGSVRGQHNLRMAMAYTCEGAASAPETSLQLALCLPPELHGLSIPLPIMNYEVELSREARKLYPHDSIRIDLCWRHRRFGLEYQGEEHRKQLGEDYARWFAAREEGYELWFVAKDQLESVDQMKHIAREVAQRIDYDVDEGLWPTDGELQDLLDTLAGRRHPKPVSFEELRRRGVMARRWRNVAT